MDFKKVKIHQLYLVSNKNIVWNINNKDTHCYVILIIYHFNTLRNTTLSLILALFTAFETIITLFFIYRYNKIIMNNQICKKNPKSKIRHHSTLFQIILSKI